MSEKSIPRQQAALVRRAKTSRWNLATSLGAALVETSLCPGKEERTMREREVQTGNSGLQERCRWQSRIGIPWTT